MNGTLLLERGSSVLEHYTTVFIDELFETERSSGALGIKEAPPKS